MQFDCLNSSTSTLSCKKSLLSFTNSRHELILQTNRVIIIMKERSNASGRSAVERERTKMRERQRRSITTNIFHGLRKHGGYRLSPRADINEVLRHLAQEAGWTVDPDGVTYRSAASTSTAGAISCPLCGGGKIISTAATPSCSFLGGGGGECSTTTSPRLVGPVNGAVATATATDDTLLAIYMSGAAPQNARASAAAGSSSVYGEGQQRQQQQLFMLRETIMSNQNTPAGSPTVAGSS